MHIRFPARAARAGLGRCDGWDGFRLHTFPDSHFLRLLTAEFMSIDPPPPVEVSVGEGRSTGKYFLMPDA
jgi:hypothetical protein